MHRWRYTREETWLRRHGSTGVGIAPLTRQVDNYYYFTHCEFFFLFIPRDSEIFSEATVTAQSEACEREEGWEEAVQECRSALAMEIKERAGLMVDIPSEGEDEWSGEEGGGECNGDGGVATPSGRKRARPLLSSGDDSEGEIGVRKVGHLWACKASVGGQ